MHSCNGSIAECANEEEMLMESEITRRFLAQQKKNYISYPTLKKDRPACDGASGQPYTKSGSCVPSQANPYNPDLCLVRASSTHSCNGSIAECANEEEMLMESEITRRFLEQQKKYISIGALKKDHPACDGASGGQPYTRSGSCAPPPANPYNRGCSKIYRCRSDD
ncbi:hypothetical protein Csa_010756 [Cucumis sativus]|nr:hypothetical protein Csa_010756 [Cucumis sativus]